MSLIPVGLIDLLSFNLEKVMDETIKTIRERHQKEIDAFISLCLHVEISNWMPFMWAPGHFSHNVKICNRCGKIVEEEP